MSVGKILLIVLCVPAVLAFGTCATCAGVATCGAAAVAEGQEEREKQEKKESLDADKCSTGVTRTWASVVAELKDNEAKVASAWKGSCVKISGVVDRINSGFDDKPYIVIGSGERFILNSAHCKPKDPKKALKLSKGKKITVWGIGGSEIVGSLMIDHCDW